MKKSEDNEAPASDIKKGRFGKGKILLGMILVVVLAGVYLYYTYGSLPSALLGAKQINTTIIISTIADKINSAQNVRLDYGGSVIINNADPIISFSYNKYDNISSSNFSLFYVSGYPNVMASAQVYDNNDSGTSCAFYSYELTNLNSTTAKILPSGCQKTNYPYAIYLRMLGELVNVSSVRINNNTNATSYSLQLFNGQPYYCVSSSGSVMINEAAMGIMKGYAPANFIFNTCLSAQYDIPLYINANVVTSSGSTMDFNITNEGSSFDG
jgi:hypothetical protein